MTVEHVRIAGVIVAAFFAAYGFYRYRRGGWSRFALLLSLLIASGVAVVSVVPQVGEIFTRLAVRQYAEKYLSPAERLTDKREILIIIPAYDEEGGIRGVLREVP